MNSPAKANNKKTVTVRALALKILHEVLQGRSLAIAKHKAEVLEGSERALTMELVQGVLRWRWKLEFMLSKLMEKPLRNKEQEIKILLLTGLYELMELSTPEYAVVDEMVKLSRKLGKKWASGLVNGVLRSFLRDKQSYLGRADSDDVAKYSHPPWLLKAIQKDWPDHWQQILAANNQRPPLWLRINPLQISRQDYEILLENQNIGFVTHKFANHALKLERKIDVVSLPGFTKGMVSVQDAGAQMAAEMLGVGKGHKVLDLCAAPGGKTSHILELQPGLSRLVAVELEESRMQRVRENLDRLRLSAELIVADAVDVSSWWDGEPFDRILIDAPCSASGVIRRHPDIKSLRKEEDLSALTNTQQQILSSAWSVLSPGGLLVYVTCSVLRQENENQIADLLKEQADAEEVPLSTEWGVTCEHGRQLLPGEEDGDGFYFACLRKATS